MIEQKPTKLTPEWHRWIAAKGGRATGKRKSRAARKRQLAYWKAIRLAKREARRLVKGEEQIT